MYYFVGSILKGRENEFAKDLHEMSKQEEFNAMSFESLIDKIRAHVAEVSQFTCISGLYNASKTLMFASSFIIFTCPCVRTVLSQIVILLFVSDNEITL